MNFDLSDYVDAMPRLLAVQATEEVRLVERFRELCGPDTDLWVWNSIFGLMSADEYLDELSVLDSPEPDGGISTLGSLLRRVYESPGSLGDSGADAAVYLVLDADEHLESASNVRRARQIAQTGLERDDARRTVAFVSESGSVPPELESYTEFVDVGLPSGDELREFLEELEARFRDWETEAAVEAASESAGRALTDAERSEVASDYEPEFRLPSDGDADGIPSTFVRACEGLTRYQITEAVQSLWIAGGRVTTPDMADYRREVVERSDMLEFLEPSETFDDIAGLEHLKAWLDEVGATFTEAGREWGLVSPRGLLQVGVPGCGKSLTAKAISNEWDLPLVRFDAGRVFSSKVGGSERNMRRALRVVESCAPCVLWLDEIEKAMSGVKSSGRSDAGTTSRVVGTFLTWFEEHSGDVFAVATSNDISKVPSELVSRFDEVFFVDLPGAEARRTCFDIHLRRYWSDPMGDLEDVDTDALAEASEDLTGREIDQVVRESLRRGYVVGRVDTSVITEVLKRKPPMIHTMSEEIDALLRWVGWDPDTEQGIRARMASEETVLAERLEET